MSTHLINNITSFYFITTHEIGTSSYLKIISTH